MEDEVMDAHQKRLGHCWSLIRGPAMGFTRAELLVIVMTIGLLVGIFLPAVAKTDVVGPGIQCLENTRQLARALLLYSADYQEYLPPNPDDGNMTPYRNWAGGQGGSGGAQEFNPDVLADPTRSLLAPYLGTIGSVFRCPSDPRTGRYSGTNEALMGQIVPAARTYSMNHAAGTDPYREGGKQPVNGPWLSGFHTHLANTTWYTFAKLTDMKNPGPAKTYLFLDEDHRSLNDATLSFVGPYPGNQHYRMIDWPGTYHDYGADFSFADGHAELHRWSDPRTEVKDSVATVVQPGNIDIEWIAQHSTALVRQAQLSVVGLTSNQLRITTPAVKGTAYVLEYSDSVPSSNWTALPEMLATNSGPLEFRDPTAPATGRFYRIRTP